MKRSFFVFLLLFLFGMSPALSWACQGADCSSAASAAADSTAIVDVDNTNSNVAVGVGGGGGSASATGGTAINNTYVAPNISPEIGVGVEVNPGQTVSPKQEQEQQLLIDDHSVVNNKYINRQLPNIPGMPAPYSQAYFGPWHMVPWNMVPLFRDKFQVHYSQSEERLEYEYFKEEVYVDLDEVKPAPFVAQLPWGSVDVRGMTRTGMGVIVLKHKNWNAAGRNFFRYRAGLTGADLVMIYSDWNSSPFLKGWSFGLGSGGSGVIGYDEKAGVSGYSGMGFGETTQKNHFIPFVLAVYYKTNGLPLRAVASLQESPSVQKSQKDIAEKYEGSK